MQINFPLCRTSGHYCLLSLQRLSWDLLETNNVSSINKKKFWRVNKIMVAEEMR